MYAVVILLNWVDFLVNDDLIHNFLDDSGPLDIETSPRPQSPPPPPYESAVASGKREDLMKRVRSYFGMSNGTESTIFSPRTSPTQNVCEDVSGLPTYEEARALRLKSQGEGDDPIVATIR